MAWCSSGRSRPQDRLHGKGMTVIRSLPPKHILKARTTDRNQPKENSSPIRKHPVMSVRAVHGDPLSKLNDPTAVRTIRATIISRTPQPCRSYRFSAVPFADSLTPCSLAIPNREVGIAPSRGRCPTAVLIHKPRLPHRERGSTGHGKVPVIRPSEEAQMYTLCDRIRERSGLPAQPVGWIFGLQPGHHARHSSAPTLRALSVSIDGLRPVRGSQQTSTGDAALQYFSISSK